MVQDRQTEVAFLSAHPSQTQTLPYFIVLISNYKDLWRPKKVL